MNGRLIYYKLRYSDDKIPDLLSVVVEEMEKFKQRMGYKPEFAVIRDNEYIDGNYPIQIIRVTKGCPPAHFILGPLIKRFPNIYTGKRLSWKKK